MSEKEKKGWQKRLKQVKYEEKDEREELIKGLN